MKIFGTKTFTIEDDVQMQAFKVCEEAFEVYQAAKHLHDYDFINDESNRRWALRGEIADVIQSALNLADLIGLTEDEIEDDMHACYRRNVCRGRVE